MTDYRYDTSTGWASKNPVLVIDEVGIETNTANRKLGDGVTPWNSLTYLVETVGTASTSDFKIRTIKITDSYHSQQQTTGICNLLADCTSNNISISLPPASYSDVIFNIKKVDSSNNTVMIDAHSDETIDGNQTITISTQYHSYSIVSDGSVWYVV